MRRAASALAVVPPRRPLRVVVGLSGGVDSSVAALLLLRAGFDVRAVFMRNWSAADEDAADVGAGAGARNGSGGGGSGSACAQQADDWLSAQRAARHLGVPLTAADFSRAYWRGVFEPFLEQLRRGRSPNPDVACNRLVKFGAFRRFALGEMRADCVATGHYGQLWPPITDPMTLLPSAHLDDDSVGEGGDESEGADAALSVAALPRPLPRLFSAVDGAKDQSDFLSMVAGADLRRVLLPLGAHTKAEVRRAAAAAGLPTAARRDSMGICFVGKRNFAAFVGAYLPLRPAAFVDVDSGRRRGVCTAGAETLTVGQAARIAGEPTRLYVAATWVDSSRARTLTQPRRAQQPEESEDFDYARNVVWVCAGEHHPALYTHSVAARLGAFSFVAGRPPAPLAAAAAAAAVRARDSAKNDAESGDESATSSSFVGHLRSWLAAAADDDDAVKAVPSEEGGAPLLAPSPSPSLRVGFRDRHRESEELAGADATIVLWSEWVAACRGLCLPAHAHAQEAQTLLQSQSPARAAPSRPALESTFAWRPHDVFGDVGEDDAESKVALEVASGGADGAAASEADDEGVWTGARARALVLVLRFDAPRRAVTPGQVLVLYGDKHVGIAVAPQPVPALAASDASADADALSASEGPSRVWRGAGRECLGGGPVASAGPSHAHSHAHSQARERRP